MKQVRRLFAFALTLVMAFAIALPALADEPTTYTISVKSTDNHTYRVYQVLTGTLANGDSKNLGNPAWGKDAKDTNANLNTFISSITAENLNQDQISKLVTAAVDTSGEGRGTVDKTNSLSVVPGYYVLVDQTTAENLRPGESLSLSLVEVVRNVEVAAKTGTTTSDKTTEDVNDSTGESATLDSADYDIGDHIPYTLTATLPQNYADYVKYYLQFQDDMSAGLTLDTGSVKIYYGDNDTTGTAITLTAANGSTYTGGQLYTYTIADVKTAASNLVAGDKIYIKYTATLNDKAVVTSEGNPNKSRVEFSKNPNWDGNGTPETGDTPWEIVLVFTYKTVINKVDGDSKPLTGADFRMDKFVKNEEGKDEYLGAKGTWVDVTTLGESKHPSKTQENLTVGTDTAANAKFTFSGLDDGYYRLVETTTPNGYNTIADIYFTITATHTVEGLQSLAGGNSSGFTLTPTKSDATLTGDVMNQAGTELPSTGGIGTTIFYVVGGVMVAGAAIFLLTKRRMAGNAE